MKMIHKLILVFSLLAILTTAANSIYFYQTRIADLDQRTYEHLNTLSTKILGEIEQYVRLMDYAIESLTADTAFMEAFHQASQLDDESGVGEMLAAQNILSRKLYQEPILEPFFRVSVYSKNGFFISSRFERTASIISMSDEAKETIATLSYLDVVDAQPFRRHIIGPHNDPWSDEFMGVFSAVRSVACMASASAMWRSMHTWMTWPTCSCGSSTTVSSYRVSLTTASSFSATGATTLSTPL